MLCRRCRRWPLREQSALRGSTKVPSALAVHFLPPALSLAATSGPTRRGLAPGAPAGRGMMAAVRDANLLRAAYPALRHGWSNCIHEDRRNGVMG